MFQVAHLTASDRNPGSGTRFEIVFFSKRAVAVADVSVRKCGQWRLPVPGKFWITLTRYPDAGFFLPSSRTVTSHCH